MQLLQPNATRIKKCVCSQQKASHYRGWLFVILCDGIKSATLSRTKGEGPGIVTEARPVDDEVR